MLLLLYQKNESRPSPSTKLSCKDSAKNRFSEGKENIFSFLSVRFLYKTKTIQNKKGTFYIFIVEMQPILSKDSAKNRFSEGKENNHIRTLLRSLTAEKPNVRVNDSIKPL